MAHYHALLLAAGCCLCASCLPLGDANDMAESLVRSRGGKVTRDESLLGLPASAAESRFKGAVIDGAGWPVVGAEVVCLAFNNDSDEDWQPYRQVGRATTDADGMFSFPAAGWDVSQGCAIAARKARLAIGFILTGAPDGEGLRVVLGPPVTLAGVVVDEAGKPVAKAEVRASIWRKVSSMGSEVLSGLAPFDWLVTTTDARGRFELKNLNQDSAYLQVAATGYATIDTPSFPQTELERSPDGLCCIVLPHESVLRGTVVEAETRRPVAEVKLHISSDTKRGVSSPGSPVVTAADGTFVARNLVEGTCYIRLTQSAKGLPDWTQAKLVEARSGDSGVVIEVTKGGILELLVTDARSGLPVEGAWMPSMQRETRDGLQRTVIKTGKDGIARQRAPEGKFTLTNIDAAHYATDTTVREVQVVNGQVRRIEVQLQPMLKVQGTVIDADGKPVEGAVIWMETGWGEPKTDAAGRFEIYCDPSQVKSGRPVIIARHVGRGLAGLERLAKDTPPVLRLAPGVEIAGRAVDPRGNPVAEADVLVCLRTQDWDTGTLDGDLMTGRDGRFVVKAIPNQVELTARLRISKQGFEDGVPLDDSGDLAIGLGVRHVEPKDFVLEPLDQTITGVVVDAAGKPVAGAKLFTKGGIGWWGEIWYEGDGEAETAADGTFTLKGLTRREYDIGVTTPDNQKSEPMKVKGGARDVRITVRAR